MFEPATAVNRSTRRSSRPSSYVSRIDGVAADQNFSDNQGDFLRLEPGSWPSIRGRSSRKNRCDFRRLRIVGIEGPAGSLVDRLIAPQRSQQTVAVTDRPAQVNELDLIEGMHCRSILWQRASRSTASSVGPMRAM